MEFFQDEGNLYQMDIFYFTMWDFSLVKMEWMGFKLKNSPPPTPASIIPLDCIPIFPEGGFCSVLLMDGLLSFPDDRMFFMHFFFLCLGVAKVDSEKFVFDYQ